MGLIHDEHDGVCAETRCESFYIHFESHALRDSSPEFLFSELAGLVLAIEDVVDSERYAKWLEEQS